MYPFQSKRKTEKEFSFFRIFSCSFAIVYAIMKKMGFYALLPCAAGHISFRYKEPKHRQGVNNGRFQ